MAKKKTAVLASLIGLPLALHGQSIEKESGSMLVDDPAMAAHHHIEASLPLANLVSGEILQHQDYQLIRPVENLFQPRNAKVISSELLLELAQVTRSTRF